MHILRPSLPSYPERRRGFALAVAGFRTRRIDDGRLNRGSASGRLVIVSLAVRLPLVPGYVSMLSGIGMEQLRQGQQPRGGLLPSPLAFVAGFSAVFIAFGASASAVGRFLRQIRSLQAPVAGALIFVFGLHLLGWLMKLSFRVGLVIGRHLSDLHSSHSKPCSQLQGQVFS